MGATGAEIGAPFQLAGLLRRERQLVDERADFLLFLAPQVGKCFLPPVFVLHMQGASLDLDAGAILEQDLGDRAAR